MVRTVLHTHVGTEYVKQAGALYTATVPLDTNIVLTTLNKRAYSESARDLGILLDDNLALHQHIRNVCRSASWGIGKIGKLRKFLNKPAVERLVHAFVTSHLDYCNCLSISSSTRRLRSAATAHLQLCPGPRTITRYGDRAFTSIAPKLWNNLPVDIRSAPTLDFNIQNYVKNSFV